MDKRAKWEAAYEEMRTVLIGIEPLPTLEELAEWRREQEDSTDAR